MRTLEQALQEHELIVLRVIGEWMELDLTGEDKPAAVEALAAAMAQVDLVEEMKHLDPEEVAALNDLAANNGRIPVATFIRNHGEVRQMGPGAMAREEPWLDPASPAESLWYRGFLYRGFDETDEGLIEFFYLPRELAQQLPSAAKAKAKSKAAGRQSGGKSVAGKASEGKTASSEPGEPKENKAPLLIPIPAPDQYQAAVSDAVDDLTTLLAISQRTGLSAEARKTLDRYLFNADPHRRSLLLTLANDLGLVRQTEMGIRPTRAAVDWLQQGREQQLRSLLEAWSNSGWNELRHTPGLVAESEGWENDPLLARTALLEVLPRDNEWYLIHEVVALIKRTDTDFQRPDGNYETWYIRDAATNEYLSGFERWDQVEGRLLAFLIQGPLFWLGAVELATAENPPQAAYRLSERAHQWLNRQPAAEDAVRVPLVVQPDGTLLVPHNASRYDRFQAARIGEPLPATAGKPYTYRITPASLQLAQDQGITPERLLQFLEKASGRPIPPGVRRGVVRWADNGVEGKLEAMVVLRVRDANILNTLRNNPKTRDFIAESLGDLAAVIRRKEWAAFRSATAQLGLLLDADVEE